VVRKNGSAPWLGLVALLIAIPGCGNAAPAGQASPPPQAPAAGDVLATIDGVSITRAEVEDALGVTLAKVEEQAYQLRRGQLDEMIATRLLEAEAKKRGVTVDQLVEQEVKGKAGEVTSADVDAFVKINRHRIQGDPAQLTPQITAYLRSQRESERREEYVDGLRKAARVEVRLAAPPVFRAKVATEGFPSRGPADAPVTIVEFSDFHCPFCRSVQPTLNALLQKYPSQVRLVYRHFPLDSLHPQARRASEASWCAAEQNRFWEFHDRVYASGPDASEETIRRLAREAGLDAAKLESCLASGRAAESIEKDLAEGSKFGVTGTPGFFVNGRTLSGHQPLESFVKIIDEELAGTR
jgi:protein-disulfide isomerase